MVLVVPALAFAHDAPPAHSCAAPTRPADKTNELEWNGFVDAMNAYRACMSAFIEANHAGSDHHRQAANAATEEWNAFVRGSLNVPEDFPWPPETESDR